MLIQGLQLLLSLSILVVLHEAGHFLPARLFKIRVEKFYLFFDAWFSLFKFKKGDTEYGIGWLPLGGYVKISGMIDESMDKDQMNSEPQPWEFRSKPAWQRLIVMVGGVTVNLILGFLIYMMVMGVWGEDKLPPESVVNGYDMDSVLEGYGLEDGDHIISMNGEPFENANDISKILLLEDVRSIEYKRNGTSGKVALPEDFGQILLDSGVRRSVIPRIPTIVDSVFTDTNADKSGLKKGDQITAVNGKSLPFFGDFSKTLQALKEDTVTLNVTDTNGKERELEVLVTKNGTLGFQPRSPMKILKTEHIDYSFSKSFGAGYALGKDRLSDYVVSLKFMFSSAGIKQMGGFGAIGGMFNPEWDWQGFWIATAFLSLILAFMNILPIPALDGGHVMFLLYEIITGKAPPQRFMEVAQLAGMLLLITLVLYANGNDLFKAIFGQ
ncbi:MAG: RIP metalloprotease RseP [Flavobacteriales bacterium]